MDFCLIYKHEYKHWQIATMGAIIDLVMSN